MTFKVRLSFIGVGLIMIALTLLMSDRLRFGDQQGLQAAFNAEFLVRPDGYPGLSRHYNFSFPAKPIQMDTGLMYRAVSDGGVDVICGFATDGRIQAYDLVMLEDDKQFFPPYYAAPLIRRQTLERFPELADILGRLENKIDNSTMQLLNYKVDNEGKRPSAVAHDFLAAHGLIPKSNSSRIDSSGSLVVGGKEFTEQEVLGEILAILIEKNSSIKVERKLNLGGTMICFNALKSGDIDLYAEYTGTGLVTILKEKVISDPQKVYEVVKEKFAQKYGLVWLGSFGFNNTYTLTMRREQARKLNIGSISDLAMFMEQDS